MKIWIKERFLKSNFLCRLLILKVEENKKFETIMLVVCDSNYQDFFLKKYYARSYQVHTFPLL